MYFFFLISSSVKHQHADFQSLFSASKKILSLSVVSVKWWFEGFCVFLFVCLLAFSCHSNYCAWSSRHRFDGKLNSVFSEQTDGALLQRDRLVKVSEGPVSVKRTWPLSCISMFAGAYKGVEKGFHYVTIFKHIFCVQMFMLWILTL